MFPDKDVLFMKVVIEISRKEITLLVMVSFVIIFASIYFLSGGLFQPNLQSNNKTSLETGTTTTTTTIKKLVLS